MTGCRIHGKDCRIPWGYDGAHTDSARPYELDELAIRDEAPHRYAYPTARDYERGFSLWRALKRDDRLTAAEERAREPVVLARLGIAAASYGEAIDNAVASVRHRYGIDG